MRNDVIVSELYWYIYLLSIYFQFHFELFLLSIFEKLLLFLFANKKWIFTKQILSLITVKIEEKVLRECFLAISEVYFSETASHSSELMNIYLSSFKAKTKRFIV